MKKLFVACAVGASLLAVGCTTTGNKVLKEETSETVEQKLTPGMSKSEVTNIFGQPLDVSFTDSGNEIWKYSFAKTKLKAKSFIPYYGLLDSGAKGKAKTLVVLFGDDGKLVKHTMSSSDIDINTGIFN